MYDCTACLDLEISCLRLSSSFGDFSGSLSDGSASFPIAYSNLWGRFWLYVDRAFTLWCMKCPNSRDVYQMSFDSLMNNKVRLFSSEKKSAIKNFYDIFVSTIFIIIDTYLSFYLLKMRFDHVHDIFNNYCENCILFIIHPCLMCKNCI